ncbi:MAG: hypothetical protein K2F56_01690, partial [Anaeroplasmataceae bacterium]|nr:hypothetical protein [Anaeroplasmataceae bacterium]
ITGYKYKSSNITNNYITFKRPLPFETFERIKDKGIFQYEIDINDLDIPEEKQFSRAEKSVYIKNASMKLFPYQNETILYKLEDEKNKYTHPNYPKVYLTLPLANRLLKEGRMGTSYRGDGYLSIKNFYIETVEELLGSCVTTSRNFYDVIGIVDSDVECILYTDSYFITSTSALPYSIYKKYNPDAPLLENGRVLILGPTEYQIGDRIFEFLSDNESYIVQGIYDSVLTLDDKNVQYVVSDYNYYEKNLPSFFYTTNLEEVTSILEEENVLYQLTAVNMYESIDSLLNQLNTILLSVMSVLLIFTLFFIILATANYITHQIWDIIILRNMGITKTTVVHTYA